MTVCFRRLRKVPKIVFKEYFSFLESLRAKNVGKIDVKS